MNWNNDSMSCEQARAAIADSILGETSAVDASTLDAHLASCAACRTYRADCQAMWDGLGALPSPSPRADSRARFLEALRRERGRAMSAAPAWTRRSVIAAGFVGAMLFGYGAASLRTSRLPLPQPVAAVDASSQQYLLLLYDTETSGLDRSDAQIAATIAEYSAWARGLRADGKLVSAEKLSDAPSEWFGGSVVATKGERIGGFFLIRAPDIAEARRIAQDCPHVRHGGRVELRAIQKT